MKKILKWIGVVFGGLIGLVILAAVGLSIAGEVRLNKTRDVKTETILIPSDEAALARGAYLVHVACKSCHGADLSGQPILEDPAIGTVYATNLTGLSQTHTDADLVRAIRHAVDRDGRQMIIMPAESFIYFSQEDLGAIIAHLKTVPRSGNDTPSPQLGLMGRILVGAGQFNPFPAETIDHALPFPEMPKIGVNVEYGEYLSRFCSSCHGPDLAGGQPADPASPPAPNITPAGRVGTWSEAEFIQTMRTGVTPYSAELDPTFMPWQSFAKFDDVELKGLWMFIQSLPSKSVDGSE